MTDGSVLPPWTSNAPKSVSASDDDCSMINHVLHDLVITRAGTENFMDVLRGASLSCKETTQPRRQVLVDQESHADGRSTR
jgi:hypothetical protein